LNSDPKYLINIVGPTGIGKTSLSIKLAQHFNTEIISCDSRQFYSEMSIGTAVPDKDELSAAKHHFIQHLSVKDPYSVGKFEKDALKTLNSIFTDHDFVIMVGGSGLYSNAVVYGLDDFPEVKPEIRNSLNTIYKEKGLKPLQKQLEDLDPIGYKTIAIQNPVRVIRALEICITSNQPYSSFLNKKKNGREFKTITIGLKAEREVIYNRINKRVDIMLENGLLKEVKQLEDKRHLNALNTVGYKELFNYLDGKWSLEFAVSEIKKNTRRFAKRQLTWYRKQEDIIWFDYLTNPDTIISKINEII